MYLLFNNDNVDLIKYICMLFLCVLDFCYMLVIKQLQCDTL